jgi:hypothetical protein
MENNVEKDKLYEQWCDEFYDIIVEEDDDETGAILDEQDFRSIAIGFFVAKGLSVLEAYNLYESHCIPQGKY